MGTTTKGLEPQKTTTQEAANVVSKGQPAQGMGPLLGAGGASMSTAGDEDEEGADLVCLNDPVDALSGNVVDWYTDIDLPGVLPVELMRHYNTAFRDQPSMLGGFGWCLSIEQWIDFRQDPPRVRESNGRFLQIPSLSVGEQTYIRSKKYSIERTSTSTYRITQVTNRVRREFSVSADESRGLLRRVVDARGNHVDLLYESGRLTEIADTAQRRVVFKYDELERVVRIDVFVEGKSEIHFLYGYHSDGELAWAEDALGNRHTYEYDAAHRLVKHTQENGVAFHYEYEATTGRCIHAWGDGGIHEYRFLRENAGDHTLVTATSSEQPKLFKFNLQGDLIEELTLDGVVIARRTYDSDHYLLTETNGAGEAVQYQYDARGHQCKEVDAAGNVRQWEYRDDQAIRLVAPNGLQSTFSYNSFGELVGAQYATGAAYAFEYDEHGRLTSIFGPSGTIVTYAYDPQHNIAEERDALGAVWGYTSDPLGRPVTRVTPLGHRSSVEYDVIGRATRIVLPDGGIYEYRYDALGRLAEFTDPLGQSSQMSYAGTGVLVSQTLPDGSTWNFEYDSFERLRRIRNPKSETYEFFFDQAGRLEREVTFDRRVMTFRYDTAGRLVRLEQPDGTWRRFAYDTMGNVVEEDTPHGVQKYERDVLGRLLSATNFDGPEEFTVAFEYDEFGRVIKEKQGQHLIEHSYDSQGQRVRRVVPACGDTQYRFDANGSVAALIHQTPSGARQELLLDRDAMGREVSRRTADGLVRIDQAFDAMNRLVEQKLIAPKSPGQSAESLLSKRNWRYDSAGRPSECSDSRWGTTRYSYDTLSRLTRMDRGQLHQVFEYQANGSLIRALDELAPGQSAASSTQWFAAEGNLIKRTERFEYEYDLGHRRIARIERSSGDRTEYTWDCRDRLREVRLPDGRRARYFYDAFGRRVRKEVHPNPNVALPRLDAIDAEASDANSQETEAVEAEAAFGATLVDTLHQLAEIGLDVAPRITQFLWDHDVLAAELDSESGPRGYVHDPDSFEVLLHVEGGEVLVVVSDHVGMPRDLIDQSGSVRWSCNYSPWGKVVEEYVADQQNPRGPPARRVQPRSPFRLQGQYWDEESGLACTRFRYWDPDTGRWLSPDPLGILGSENQFGLDGSPTTHVDPLGLNCKTLAAKVRKKGVKSLTDAEVQEAIERIHKAQFGLGKGKGVPYALTITKDGRVVVSSVGQIPGPGARKMAQQIFGKDVEFVGGTTSNNASGKNGTHAEARAIEYLGEDARGARQACTHYSCDQCEKRQDRMDIDNVTGNASDHDGKITRPFSISR